MHPTCHCPFTQIRQNPPNPPKDEKFPEIKKTVAKDDFLISALPMTIKIETLQNAYERINQGRSANDDEEISACVYHDLANYEIQLGLSQESFLELLKENFFQHAF